MSETPLALDPCPFCGATPRVYPDGLLCPTDGCVMDFYVDLEAWNRRALASSPPQAAPMEDTGEEPSPDDSLIGRLTRRVEYLEDSQIKRNDWLREAKQDAGYHDSVSFDVVWAAALKALKAPAAPPQEPAAPWTRSRADIQSYDGNGEPVVFLYPLDDSKERIAIRGLDCQKTADRLLAAINGGY